MKASDIFYALVLLASGLFGSWIAGGSMREMMRAGVGLCVGALCAAWRVRAETKSADVARLSLRDIKFD